MARPTVARIDLDALRYNYRLAASLSGSGRAMPVVKANAYGHGAANIAQALEPLAPALGVAFIEEAVQLRDAGIGLPILLMEGIFSAGELALAAQLDFWVMVQNDEQLAWLDEVDLSGPVTCWIKLDTGMHRLGFDPARATEIYRRLQHCPQVAPGIVLGTHFSSADVLDEDSTEQQIRLFRAATAGLDAPASIANSPGLLGWPDSRAEWNRPGLMIYGLSPFTGPHPEADKLKPVMTLESKVMAVRKVEPGESVGYGLSWTASRPSTVATVPVGYGDGYPRRARNGTPVLINGQLGKLVGRVSMDMITIDVTDLAPVQIGDPVICWGNDLPANQVADCAETIGYEIVTRVLSRVPREYSA